MKVLDDFLTHTDSFLSWTSVWTIWWLLVMVSWLSWIVKSDSCSLSVTCFSDLSKQYYTYAVLDITSDGRLFTLDRRYSLTSLLHSSTAILTSAIQLSLNKVSAAVWSAAHLNLLLHFELPTAFHVKPVVTFFSELVHLNDLYGGDWFLVRPFSF